MEHIKCADCLKTYRPYRYDIAFARVLMKGFSDWWEFEDERVIEEQFREHSLDPYLQRRLINKMGTYSRDSSFAADFKFYYQYLENKRRETVSATFLCFDCEKYYCTNCVFKHSGHFTFSTDDKYNISKWGTISVEILQTLKAEGDQKLKYMKREQTLLCDVVDVRCEHDKLDLDFVLHRLNVKFGGYGKRYIERMPLKLVPLFNPRLKGLHILIDNKKWLVTDEQNKCIKIFNVNDKKMTRCIKLSSPPYGITEIPSTDPSQSLIAVSFPLEEQIHIMNIHTTPAQVVSSISVECRYYDLAYCNNKLITWCWDYLDGEWRHSIHVMDISGEIINIIDLEKLPGFKLRWYTTGCMSVHSESETIYVCHANNPSCVISLSLHGQVLHSVTFTNLEPACTCVDKEQNVYVTSHFVPIYKLSSDLRHWDEVIDKDVVKTPTIITAMRFHHDKFYLASYEGPVCIIQHE